MPGCRSAPGFRGQLTRVLRPADRQFERLPPTININGGVPRGVGIPAPRSCRSATFPCIGPGEASRATVAAMAEFVPPDFSVPLRFATSEFVLEPLGPEHNASDYDAWTWSARGTSARRPGSRGERGRMR